MYRSPTAVLCLSAALALSACAGAPAPGSGDGAGGSGTPQAGSRPWSEVLAEAEGQTVDLWMFGGDDAGNAYVDDTLAPAAAELGVTLRRVPIADTGEAIRRMLAENAAGRTDGSVDLVWVNGDNFATGRQADAWLCGWAEDLPNRQYVASDDPLVAEDFGVPVDGCESPWHKAQFTFVYDAARVDDPPTSLAGLLDWAEANPGRFTYPAPPDFTGSVFLREALYSVAGGPDEVPDRFDQAAYDDLTPALFERLREVAPSLWREGSTYPRDEQQLLELFADGEVDYAMTYGPATLEGLVADGTLPDTTTVLTLDEGTVGNASFLGLPAAAGDQAGAMVVANLALSPEQQAAKADPEVWGQFTVLDVALLDAEDQQLFDALPESEVLPPYEQLSENAQPELGSDWVGPLDEGWRRQVLAQTQ